MEYSSEVNPILRTISKVESQIYTERILEYENTVNFVDDELTGGIRTLSPKPRSPNQPTASAKKELFSDSEDEVQQMKLQISPKRDKIHNFDIHSSGVERITVTLVDEQTVWKVTEFMPFWEPITLKNHKTDINIKSKKEMEYSAEQNNSLENIKEKLVESTLASAQDEDSFSKAEFLNRSEKSNEWKILQETSIAKSSEYKKSDRTDGSDKTEPRSENHLFGGYYEN